ncbi:MAG: hypothetical protein WD492_15445 [Alkalispirochaeta sp.]
MNISSLIISPFLGIALGLFGFGVVLLYDYRQAPPTPAASRLTALISCIGAAGVLLATISLFFLTPLPVMSPFATIPIIALALVSVTLLIRSVYTEIPHSEIRTGLKRLVIRSGSYAWSRHPGFLWYCLLVLAIALRMQHFRVWAVGFFLVVLDLLVVVIEDRILFPRIFEDYGRYQRDVPMLIPRFKVADNRDHE